MNTAKPVRKRRVDRNHVIYKLTVPAGVYVGVTAKTETTALRSARTRAAKHWYRAQTEGKDWLLCKALRQLEDRCEIAVTVLAVVRGRAAAHREEVRLRRELKPNLNTDVRGD